MKFIWKETRLRFFYSANCIILSHSWSNDAQLLFYAGCRNSSIRSAPHVRFVRDALYLLAASRSTSTRDFPHVTRRWNRSVSRYDDIQDDWPIAISVPLWKIDSYWRTNWPKLSCGRMLRVSRTYHPQYRNSFLSHNKCWPEVSSQVNCNNFANANWS